jgi:hypothetical protein
VRLDHLLSKEHWPHTPEGSRGVGSMTRAAGECSAGGLLISGALAIRFFLVDPRCEYCPSPFFGTGAGFRKSIGGMGWGGWSTLLGPEETDTRLFLSGVGCLQVAFELVSPGWWGGFGRTGRSGLHTASVLLALGFQGWGFRVVWWWCGLVSVRVLRTA